MNDGLVVEDESDVQALVDALLAVEGIPDRTVVHGGEALGHVREARPAVVLLDIHVPHVNGPAFCKRLHTDGSREDNAIVVMTAEAQAAAERPCAADATLPKPLDLDQLVAVVTRFLHQNGGESVRPGNDPVDGASIH